MGLATTLIAWSLWLGIGVWLINALLWLKAKWHNVSISACEAKWFYAIGVPLGPIATILVVFLVLVEILARCDTDDDNDDFCYLSK